MTTVTGALQAARGKLAAAEARLLLGHVLQQSAVWLLTHDDTELEEEQLTRFASLCARRRGGEPIAYLLGTREFYGREFHVAPGVLIPRPETELLVDIAKRKVGGEAGISRSTVPRLPNGPASGRHSSSEAGGTAQVLDLGTGSGCIAISIALECPQCEVVAVDASPAALTIARENVQRMGANVRLIESDWFDEIAAERFDLIVSNPPYIAAADPHLALGDLRHEPPTALASGKDGLDAIRRIVSSAPHFLRPHGSLWLEHGYDQANALREMLAADFVDIEQIEDLAGIIRISGGTRK